MEYEIIWKVRRLDRALAAKSDETLKPMGLSVAERAVLEFLHTYQALTVPQIARRFQVSRQHIQINVNSLLKKGLIIPADNPDHVRSPLLGLTEKGVTTFAAIRDMETDLIGRLFGEVPTAEKVVTSRVLEQLIKKLQ